MRHLTLLSLAVCAALALNGCSHRKLAGTQIDDTPETRELLAVMERYRSSIEARDAAGVIALVSDNFRDDAGTPNPADDLDYASLRQILPDRMAKLADVSLEISVRKVTIEGDTANVIYHYTSHFKIPRLTGKAQNEGDIKQMWFKRVGGQWKIVSGI